MQFSYCFLTSLCLCCASAKSVFNGMEQDNKWPRLLNTEDSRVNGISYEINRALVAEHLKATSNAYPFEGPYGNELEDLMKPGAQHIWLSHWDHWASRRTDKFLRILIDSELSKESKWTIDVRGNWGYEGNRTLLAEVIRTLPAISEFHWDTQRWIPAIVLDSLQKYHPDCHLYYTVPLKMFDGSQSPEFLAFNAYERSEQNTLPSLDTQQVTQETTPQSIFESKNLYSLKAHINPLFYSEKLDLIHQILLTCPNIRELDLKIDVARCSPDPSICCEDPSRNLTLAFDFTKHDGMLPPLEVLKLVGYRFDFAANGTHADPEVNMPLEMANLKEWKKHMDADHLRSLHLSNPLTQELIFFAAELPNLRHLRIDGGWLHYVRPRLLKFLTKIPPLESLALEEAQIRPVDTLLDVIEAHHPTLRSFKLNHQQDAPRTLDGTEFWANHFQYSSEELLGAAQLSRLFQICPDLQSLDLDIETGADWNYKIFDKLLSFPQLKELTLRFPPETHHQLYHSEYLPRHRQIDQPELKLTMQGLRNYFRDRKVGEPFKVLRTFLGWREFGDIDEDPNHGPSWMA